MVCDKCDPLKLHRQTDVSTIVIPVPAIGLEENEEIEFKIMKCKICNQQFSIPKYNQ